MVEDIRSPIILINSKKFKSILYTQSLNSKNKVFRVIHVNLLGKTDSFFLWGLTNIEENCSEWNNNCFDSEGLICFDKETLQTAKSMYHEAKYFLFYELEKDSLQLYFNSKNFVLEEKEWLNKSVILYTNFVCWEGKIPSKEFLTHVEITGLGVFPVSSCENKIKLNIPQENFTAFVEQIKLNSRKDGLNLMTELPTIYLRLLFTLPPIKVQSKICRISEYQNFFEYFSIIYIDDFLHNNQLLEIFFSQLFDTKSLKDTSLIATYSQKNEIIFLKQCITFKEVSSEHIFRSILSYKMHLGKLRNVHFPVLNMVPGKKTAVKPNYIYFHYKQDGANDEGWGCAYRSLQTLASHIVLNSNNLGFIPDIRKIQEILVNIGDKPFSFIGSREWIGSFEVSFVLKKIFNIDCNILHAASGNQMVELVPALRNHFQNIGTPVMIGGGSLAYTLLGIAEDEEDNVQFLILDPHYKGLDDLKTVINPKTRALYWTTSRLFSSSSFYNICCPNI